MKSISIKNYKNLNGLTIESLSQVNLIVGKNNVGKSTLLEAISIFATGGDISWLYSLLEMRGISFPRSYSEENRDFNELEVISSLYTNRNLAAFYEESIVIYDPKDFKPNENGSDVSLKLVSTTIDSDKYRNFEIALDEFKYKSESLNSTPYEYATNLLSTKGLTTTGFKLRGVRPISYKPNKSRPFEFIKT